MNIFIKSVLIKAATPFSPLLKKFPNIIWKIRYCKDYKKFPNLKKPQSFMEKILWLSLYSDTSMWSKLADKYRVREYVIDRCGEQYVNKIYGIYNSAIEIDYSLLPKSFVLKTTNSCATNIIVKDKNILNIKETNHKLNKWLKFPYGELTGQLHYTQIEPLIIAEKFMEQTKKSEQSLIDYKFFFFILFPKYVVIYSDREENTHNYSVMVYDMDWNAYPEFVNSRCPISDIIPRPSALEEMISIASRLSEPFPFVRVDLYLINGSPIFGEMTFTPDVISNITPELTDQMSKWIDITSLKQQL